MAIQFARIELVGRATGGNACCKGAYNARSRIKDNQTNVTYNFQNKGDNVHHEILLPNYVDQKFKSTSELMNEIELSETRKNSSLLKDIVIALPDDKELNLQDRINIIHRVIDKMEWVKEGLGVQLDIHEPHDGEKNWHAHILLPKRRFAECGTKLGEKARDLDIQIRGGKNPFGLSEEQMIHEKARDIVNDYCKEMGYKTRVDTISLNPHEHVGPVRMRSILNQAAQRNEERREAEIEHLSNGSRVLEKVTKHMSVFTKDDLTRAVKCIPDREMRARLVEDALSSKSLISLYDESGRNTGCYTTGEIRAEEEKLLRLSSYVANQQNVVAGNSIKEDSTHKIQQLLNDSNSSFSPEQEKALSELLLNASGLRILRGRAGTGKSYVLGELGSIARVAGVNVIGIAPTHKAKNELASRGYEQNDTVKGMLFKLHNGRFELAKHSLLVVDEAGMIGNDDFKELLRVAASRKCNVILSGDEKQLASVQRGGMFEVFAESYGSSSILNIQRQKDAWGRLVAMAFSNGEVRSGISILQKQNKIIEKATRDESMQTLLADWSKSDEQLTDRLIIAVKNIDVSALNHGARQYLKLEGVLQGEEIAVGGNHYMKGDRILIKETNKALGLVNGDFATVIDASKERFVVSVEGVGDKSDNAIGVDKVNDNSRLVEFDPSEYRGFKHGYATTVFKSQGASIKDVYVFHDGFAGIRNSYVALSRHVKELGLYINNQSTRSVAHLIKQLGHDPEIGSSLSYLSKQDVDDRKIGGVAKQDKNIVGNLITRAALFASKKLTAFADKHISDSEYYHYKAPELKREKVEAVLDVVTREMDQEAIGNVIALEERAVVGGNTYPSSNILNKSVGAKSSSAMTGRLYSNNTRQTAKEYFYAKADYIRKQANNSEQKAKWDLEAQRLRSEVKYKSEAIARDLLGEPNKSLSNQATLRFGEHGRVAVGISGERMGSWYDFAREKGGDMFSLVQDKQGCDFQVAAEYLRRSVGMEAGSNSHLQLVDDHRNKDLTQRHIKAKATQERINKAKAGQVEKLYSRARDISNQSVAFKYLTLSRGIDVSIGIGEDIKSTGIYVPNEILVVESTGPKKGKYLPAIVAFARDSEGRVTGGQQILLNKSSGAKADVAIPKKSFGRIAGSFVDVGQINSGAGTSGNNILEKDKITIIAEGLETALSVKQGLREHSEKLGVQTKTLCSLGISNIKNYQPSKDEKIIIAADNDGINSATSKTIENARIKLEEKGAFVEIVSPSEQGDFNDILKSEGELAISEAFEPAIAKHMAQTLAEYFTKDVIETKLDEHHKSNLAYIEKYDLPQEDIVDAYRQGDISGKLALEETRKGLEMAASNFGTNKEIYKEARGWGYGANEREITKSMIGMDDREALEHSRGIRDGVLKSYFEDNLDQFKSQKNGKNDLELLKPIICAEQEFLKTTYESLKSPIEEQSKDNQEYLQAGKLAATKPEILEDVFSLASRLQNTGATMQASLEELQNSRDLKASCKKIGQELEEHHINSTLDILEKEKQEATTPNEILSVIGKEQKFLSGLHNNIKYLEQDANIVEKCELAYNQGEANNFEDLKEIAERSLESGAKTNESLLKDLQQVTDLKHSCRKIGGDIESHYINKTINAFEAEKNNAKEPLEVLKAIAAKHLYLSGVDEKLEYPEYLDKEIVNAIEIAKHDKQWNRLDDLNELVSFVAKETVYDNTAIIKHLKEPEDLRSIVKNLTTNYQDRYLQNIEQNVERIEKQGSLIVGEKRFDCALKYIEYEARYSHEEYVSQRELSKIQENVVSKQLEDERLAESATKEQEREAYKGMDFEM